MRHPKQRGGGGEVLVFQIAQGLKGDRRGVIAYAIASVTIHFFPVLSRALTSYLKIANVTFIGIRNGSSAREIFIVPPDSIFSIVAFIIVCRYVGELLLINASAGAPLRVFD